MESSESTKKMRRKMWKGKEQKVSDTVLKDGRKDDIIIPIMGPTGVGKSSFINTAIGRDAPPVGHDLKSGTAEIVHAIVPYPSDPNRRVIFIDTPGFDDTDVDDSEILRQIAVWLAFSYSDDMKLAGVIYLHEISQTRMLGTSRKNLSMFRKLCGNDALKNIILATTKWGDIEEEAGLSREEQLRSTFWKDMIGHGSRMERFKDSRESAWEIIDMMIADSDADPLDALQIQKELVDLHKILPETEAGNAVRIPLNELIETRKKTVAQLQNTDGLQEDEDLQRKPQDTEAKLRALPKQVRQPNTPLGRRIMGVFGLRL